MLEKQPPAVERQTVQIRNIEFVQRQRLQVS
jgi:hypothetical protein